MNLKMGALAFSLVLTGCGYTLMKKTELVEQESNLKASKNERDSLSRMISGIKSTELKVDADSNKSEFKLPKLSNDYWVHSEDPLTDKNRLYDCLGKIVLGIKSDNSVKLQERESIDLDSIKAVKKMQDNGSNIFDFYSSKSLITNIKAVSDITASLSNSQCVRLSYDVVGTSSLDFGETQLQKEAKNFEDMYDTSKVTSIYMCAGVHIRRLSYSKFKSDSANASGSSTFIKVDGKIFSEEKFRNENWEVKKRLYDISLFFKPKSKINPVSSVQLPQNKSILETFKDVTKRDFTSQDILKLAQDTASLKKVINPKPGEKSEYLFKYLKSYQDKVEP